MNGFLSFVYSGIMNFESDCVCGGNDVPAMRIKELIVDVAMGHHYDLLPYSGYVTVTSVDFGAAYDDMCTHMLEHMQCSPRNRCSIGNVIPGNFSSWKGTCICSDRSDCARTQQFGDDDYQVIPLYRPVDVSFRISEVLFDAIVKSYYTSNIVRTTASDRTFTFDMCSSAFAICNLLTRIANYSILWSTFE